MYLSEFWYCLSDLSPDQALTVLDYLLHAGSENVVIYFKDNIYIIKTLKEFQFVDEYGKDQGANVRQKAKDITNLLQDDSRLREERRTRANMRDRLVGGQNNFDEFGAPENVNGNENDHRRSRDVPRQRPAREDDELKRAIEESKRSLVEEQARAAEENDLQKAIDLSKAEEERRNKTLEESNTRSLFDDHNPQLVVLTTPMFHIQFKLSVPDPLQITPSPWLTRRSNPNIPNYNPSSRPSPLSLLLSIHTSNKPFKKHNRFVI